MIYTDNHIVGSYIVVSSVGFLRSPRITGLPQWHLITRTCFFIESAPNCRLGKPCAADNQCVFCVCSAAVSLARERTKPARAKIPGEIGLWCVHCNGHARKVHVARACQDCVCVCVCAVRARSILSITQNLPVWVCD